MLGVPFKYVFPAGASVPANGYLLVYADSTLALTGLKTGFSLSASGETLSLYSTVATGQSRDAQQSSNDFGPIRVMLIHRRMQQV